MVKNVSPLALCGAPWLLLVCFLSIPATNGWNRLSLSPISYPFYVPFELQTQNFEILILSICSIALMITLPVTIVLRRTPACYVACFGISLLCLPLFVSLGWAYIVATLAVVLSVSLLIFGKKSESRSVYLPIAILPFVVLQAHLPSYLVN